MSPQVDDIALFWESNKIPLDLMVSAGREKYGLSAYQVEEAAKRVYAEAQEILETTEEPKSVHGKKSIEKIVLARNRLHPARLGRRVFEVARAINPVAVPEREPDLTAIERRLAGIEERLSRRWWHNLLDFTRGPVDGSGIY